MFKTHVYSSRAAADEESQEIKIAPVKLESAPKRGMAL